MRTPLGRFPGSPALAFLRDVAFRAPDASSCHAWASRLAAGGIVRECARERDLRRALPHLGRWIEAAGLTSTLPPDERATLAAARLSSQSSVAKLAATLNPLGTACRNVGVAPLLLKGAALHGALHTFPADRPVSDADLFIAYSDWPAFSQALGAAGLESDRLTAARVEDLERSAGRTSVLSDFIYRPRNGTGVPVEVKFDPVQVGVPLRRPRAFVEGAVPSPVYAGFVVPAPEAMAIQQAIHLARHDGSDALWFAELAHGVDRACRRGAFDIDRATSILAGEGLESVARHVFAAAERLFPGTIPARLRRGRGGGPTPSIVRVAPTARGGANERLATFSLQAHHAVGSRRIGFVLRSLAARIRPSGGYVAARLGLAPGTPIRAAHRRRRLLDLLRGRNTR